jgi:predicted acetyltransferase
MVLAGRPLARNDLAQAWELEKIAFNTPEALRTRWLAWVDPEWMHGLFLDECLVAMGGVLPFGQFFGGRSVPMGGLSSIAVAPEHRGKGFGGRILRALLDVMRRRGQAISALFPANTALYRAHGWELAGAYVMRSLSPRVLRALRHEAGTVVRRATLDDVPAVKACYARLAPVTNGLVDRPDSWWEWLLGGWDDLHVYLSEDVEGAASGYVVYRHTERPHGEHAGFRIHVHEVLAPHVHALAALWHVVGSTAGQVATVTYRTAPEDPLLLLLHEQDVELEHEVRWMLRLVDAPAAIAARGFPPGFAALVSLELDDRQCEWNAGRWVLEIRDGQGRLERGGRGSVRLGAGAMASLYAGWATTRVLARAGLLAGGSEADLDALDAAFAGPTAWLFEEF